MSQRSKYNSAYVYVLCCIAALAGLMFGYSTAVITGVVLPDRKSRSLSDGGRFSAGGIAFTAVLPTDANRDRMGRFQYRDWLYHRRAGRWKNCR